MRVFNFCSLGYLLVSRLSFLWKRLCVSLVAIGCAWTPLPLSFSFSSCRLSYQESSIKDLGEDGLRSRNASKIYKPSGDLITWYTENWLCPSKLSAYLIFLEILSIYVSPQNFSGVFPVADLISSNSTDGLAECTTHFVCDIHTVFIHPECRVFLPSPLIGATTTLACFAHEIPHKLRDYSILIRSGFSKKQAMQSQFLTAIGAFGRPLQIFTWIVPSYIPLGWVR